MKQSLLSTLFGERPFPANDLLTQTAVDRLLRLNDRTEEYGMVLTPADARELVETRGHALKETGRIEIGSGILERLIAIFSDSPYLWQANYAASLHRMTEDFYRLKNELPDTVGDDELLCELKYSFDQRCRGSFELLEGVEFDRMSRNVRQGRSYREGREIETDLYYVQCDGDEEEDD